MADVVRSIALEHIMLETDCPYLAPVPHRGHRNEPSYLPVIAERIAALRQTSVEEVARQTTEGARRMFGIP
jgi:TatD DNase family protein